MFEACPPFQNDADFGVPAAIAGRLLQRQDGVIDLLPALPSDSKDGAVTGLCARGGSKVEITWKNGRLVSAVMRSVSSDTLPDSL